MNKTAFALTLMTLTGLAANPVLAGPRGFIDHAKVIDVVPVYRTVQIETPHRECWQEQVHGDEYSYRSNDSYTPSILGGIVGGVVGHQLGKGRGNDIMTIAGTVLGASVGRDHGNRHVVRQHRPRTETRCEVSSSYHDEEQLEGYRVTYRYRGHEFSRMMDHDPGKRVKVRISVAPVHH